MAEKRTTYKIQDLGGIGEVHIADEVVARQVRKKPDRNRRLRPDKHRKYMNEIGRAHV